MGLGRMIHRGAFYNVYRLDDFIFFEVMDGIFDLRDLRVRIEDFG